MCTFYENPDDIIRNIHEEQCKNDASIIFKEKSEELLSLFTVFIRKQEKVIISNQEVHELFVPEILQKEYTHDADVAWALAVRVINYAGQKHIAHKERTEDGSLIIRVLSQKESEARQEKDEKEEAERQMRFQKAHEEAEKRRQEKRQEELNALREELSSVLADDAKMTISEMMSVSTTLRKNNNMKLSALLNKLTESGDVEKIIEKRKTLFALPGTTERLRQKEAQRLQEIKEYNAKIDIKIRTLESDANSWELVYMTNKGKLFDAGAKAKKEAQQKLEEIRTEIESLQSQKKKE